MDLELVLALTLQYLTRYLDLDSKARSESDQSGFKVESRSLESVSLD